MELPASLKIPLEDVAKAYDKASKALKSADADGKEIIESLCQELQVVRSNFTLEGNHELKELLSSTRGQIMRLEKELEEKHKLLKKLRGLCDHTPGICSFCGSDNRSIPLFGE